MQNMEKKRDDTEVPFQLYIYILVYMKGLNIMENVTLAAFMLVLYDDTLK